MIITLYFLTLLDKIITAMLIVAIICAVLTITFLIVKFACKSLANQYKDSNTSSSWGDIRDFNLTWVDASYRILKWSIPLTIISTILLIVTPTTKEAYIIYGVGTTIEYLKENDTAKQLPDKAINALDSWLDAITIETNNVQENNDD